MSGTLSEHTLGTFQLSGRASGGGVSTASLTDLTPSPTASSTDGLGQTLNALERPADSSNSSSTGGNVQTLTTTVVQTVRWHGTLGVHELGSSYLSGEVADGNPTEINPTTKDSDSTSEGTGGVVQTVSTDTFQSDGFATASGGITGQLLGVTSRESGFGRNFGRDFGGVTSPAKIGTAYTQTGDIGKLGGFTVGGSELGSREFDDTSDTLSATFEGVTVNPFTTVIGGALVTLFAPTTKSEGTFTSVTSYGGYRIGNEDLGTWTLGEDRSKVTLGTETFGSGVSEGIGGEVTTLESSTFLADSFSESIGGVAQSLSGSTFTGVVDTSATAEAILALITTESEQAIRFLPNWAIGQRVIGDLVDEIRTYDSMELTVRVDKGTLEDVIRPLAVGAGKVQVVPDTGGGFTIVGRGSGDFLALNPPTDRKDVRPVDTWKVQNIEEEVVGKSGQEFEVTLEVVPEKEKAFDNEYGTLGSPLTKDYEGQQFLGDFALGADDVGADDAGDWYFEFEQGDIITKRVTMDVQREPSNALSGIELTFLAEPEEVRVMEESISKLEALDKQNVPDGENLVKDNSSDQRNIVSITPPLDARGTLAVGDYYVEAWETEYLQAGAYQITMTIIDN